MKCHSAFYLCSKSKSKIKHLASQERQQRQRRDGRGPERGRRGRHRLRDGEGLHADARRHGPLQLRRVRQVLQAPRLAPAPPTHPQGHPQVPLVREGIQPQVSAVHVIYAKTRYLVKEYKIT